MLQEGDGEGSSDTLDFMFYLFTLFLSLLPPSPCMLYQSKFLNQGILGAGAWVAQSPAAQKTVLPLQMASSLYPPSPSLLSLLLPLASSLYGSPASSVGYREANKFFWYQVTKKENAEIAEKTAKTKTLFFGDEMEETEENTLQNDNFVSLLSDSCAEEARRTLAGNSAVIAELEKIRAMDEEQLFEFVSQQDEYDSFKQQITINSQKKDTFSARKKLAKNAVALVVEQIFTDLQRDKKRWEKAHFLELDSPAELILHKSENILKFVEVNLEFAKMFSSGVFPSPPLWVQFFERNRDLTFAESDLPGLLFLKRNCWENVRDLLEIIFPLNSLPPSSPSSSPLLSKVNTLSGLEALLLSFHALSSALALVESTRFLGGIQRKEEGRKLDNAEKALKKPKYLERLLVWAQNELQFFILRFSGFQTDFFLKSLFSLPSIGPMRLDAIKMGTEKPLYAELNAENILKYLQFSSYRKVQTFWARFFASEFGVESFLVYSFEKGGLGKREGEALDVPKVQLLLDIYREADKSTQSLSRLQDTFGNFEAHAERMLSYLSSSFNNDFSNVPGFEKALMQAFLSKWGKGEGKEGTDVSLD